MGDYNGISNAEWKVMKVLWTYGEATFPQILIELEDTGWSKTTIQTYLARLVKKGVIETEKAGRGYIYKPVLDENECQVSESKKFLDNVFDGSLSKMVISMLNRGNISKQEIAELKSLVDQQEDNDD